MKLIYSGKVRDMYDAGEDRLLMVATDRISCFDYVLPTPIPDKGKILTAISLFWFDYLKDIVENHILKMGVVEEEFEGRSMLVQSAKRIDLECIVRGYISGSAWSEYKSNGTVAGVQYPEGIKESDRLPEVIFTPSTKAPDGEHDINISEDEARKICGSKTYDFIREKSIALYKKAAEYADKRGIIIADTKFEFGLVGDKIILIDEALTPDSSRFWDRSKYKPGRAQDSFDKQFVRDYLIKIKWDKKPPVPALPPAIVKKTMEKYLDAQRRLTRE